MTHRVFEIWQYAGRIYGNERANLPPSIAVRGFEYAFEFRGKSATFSIVTHDINLSRDAALKFAVSIYASKYVVRTVDLSNCYLRRDDTANRLWTGDTDPDEREC